MTEHSRQHPGAAKLLQASTLLAIAVASTPSLGAESSISSKNLPDQDGGYAIVVLKGDPLSTADTTKPISGRRIDFQSGAVQSYRAQLATERARYRQWLRANVPAVKVTNEFDIALNAVSVRLNGASLTNIAVNKDVKQVSYQSLFYKFATDAAVDPRSIDQQVNRCSAQFSAPPAGLPNAGSGVKVAVIDSGIDSSHACFSDRGYPNLQHAGDIRFVNNKVVAARAFTDGKTGGRLSPEATSAHGTHVSGTIACNTETAAAADNTQPSIKMSGIAPRALLGNYNIFPGGATTARSEDVLNAMESAYLDSFDIVNFSLNAGQRSGSGIEVRALRNLDQANMFFAVAPGKNEQFLPHLTDNGAQRFITASVDSEESIPLAVISSSGTEYSAVKAAFGIVPVGGLAGPLAPVLDARQDPAATGGLGHACAPMRRFSLTGSIALVMRGACDFTTKLRNVEAAGAIGAIVVAEDGDPLIVMGANDDPVQPTIPAFMVKPEDRSSLQSNSGIATMLPSDRVDAAVDSRKQMFGGFTKLTPDPSDQLVGVVQSSPVVQVLSAVPAGACTAPPCFGLMSGQSMISASLAGTAAALRGRHPAWSAAQVRSAMLGQTPTELSGISEDISRDRKVALAGKPTTGLESLVEISADGVTR